MKKNFVKDTYMYFNVNVFFLTNVRKFLSRRISSTKLLFMKNIILLCKFTKYIFNKLSRAKNFKRIFAEYFQYLANIRRKYSPNIRRIFATKIFAKTLITCVMCQYENLISYSLGSWGMSSLKCTRSSYKVWRALTAF